MPTSDEAFARAVEHLQAGQWQAAEEGLRRLLSDRPNDAGAWHQLGILAYQTEKYETAIEYFGRAIAISGKEADFHVNLGNAFLALGKLDRAIECYRHTLELKPDHSIAHYNLSTALYSLGELPAAVDAYLGALEPQPDYAVAHYNLGNSLRAQGNLAAAVVCFKRATELNPEHAEAHNNLGNAWQAQGKLDEAVSSYCRALELKPAFAEAHSNLGNALQAQGQLNKAVDSYRRALELNSDLPEVHHNLGNALQSLGDANAAVVCYQRALALRPELAEAHNNLGNAFRNQGNFDEAIASYGRALKSNPGYAEAHYNLGSALQAQGDLQEAVSSYRRALELNPDDARVHNNLGAALRSQGKLDEAADSYSRALELNPDDAGAHTNRSMLLLGSGNFESGWPEYEWRWKTGQLVQREDSHPLWDGSPLNEKAIFLAVEQGFGDTFQFIRYAALVKKQNPRATVIAECQPAVLKLLARCPGFDRPIAEGDELPMFDAYAPLISLASVFRTTLETIPSAVPYLFADQRLVEKWRDTLATITGFRIGVNWHGRLGQGEFRKRDIPAEYITALTHIPDVVLIPLQRGEGERLAACAPGTIFDPGPDCDAAHGAFMDTAAIMMNVDLVLTSDTSVPHLAGALGVPVWLALPFAPDWRWLLDRDDSPWYPTMRIFRQKKPGDWSEVFERILAELKALAPANLAGHRNHRNHQF